MSSLKNVSGLFEFAQKFHKFSFKKTLTVFSVLEEKVTTYTKSSTFGALLNLWSAAAPIPPSQEQPMIHKNITSALVWSTFA